jgi:hypothetical protein
VPSVIESSGSGIPLKWVIALIATRLTPCLYEICGTGFRIPLAYLTSLGWARGVPISNWCSCSLPSIAHVESNAIKQLPPMLTLH